VSVPGTLRRAARERPDAMFLCEAPGTITPPVHPVEVENALAADRQANDVLPLTPAGKIQKAVLRQRVQKGS
jgi:acyl-CoA synthetase (AMP-forming)/AMP-acid ligase II